MQKQVFASKMHLQFRKTFILPLVIHAVKDFLERNVVGLNKMQIGDSFLIAGAA